MDTGIQSQGGAPFYGRGKVVKDPKSTKFKLFYPIWTRKRIVSRSAVLYGFFKRAFDLTGIVLALPFVAPLLLVIACAIKFDSPGPLVFSHVRTGRNGSRFRMYKFRTMVVGADAMKKELAALNELEWPEFKITNDPRITRIGKFLRKTSLDELPQLFNVLRGEMSLVGPRPCSIAVTKYQSWQLRRLDAVPGLTGPSQIWARNANFDEKCDLDIHYLEHRTLLLDLFLLFQTMRIVFVVPNGK